MRWECVKNFFHLKREKFSFPFAKIGGVVRRNHGGKCMVSKKVKRRLDKGTEILYLSLSFLGLFLDKDELSIRER